MDIPSEEITELAELFLAEDEVTEVLVTSVLPRHVEMWVCFAPDCEKIVAEFNKVAAESRQSRATQMAQSLLEVAYIHRRPPELDIHITMRGLADGWRKQYEKKDPTTKEILGTSLRALTLTDEGWKSFV